MPRHTLVAIRKLVTSFTEATGGSVAITFVLALIPIMIGAGAAVDYSRANNFKSAMQAALDAAVLAGAKDASSTWTQIALNVFNSNMPNKFGAVPTPSFTLDSSTGYYTGTVTGSQPTTVLAVAHINSMSVTVRASATPGAVPDTSCILTYDQGQPTSDIGLKLNGGPNINLTGCALKSNTSMQCSGSNGNAPASYASGTASGCNNTQTKKPVTDIYAARASNITKKCGASLPGVTWTPGSVPTGSGIITVNQGSYIEYHICGDLTVSGSGYLTGSAPALETVIVIENGIFNVSNNAVITSLKTTVVLTGDNNHSSQVNFPNGNGKSASLTLSPPTSASNPWQSVSLYQDPAMTNNVDETWGPATSFTSDGLVYLPHANVTANGNAGSGNLKCSKVVVNKMTINGSVAMNYLQSSSACDAIGLKQATTSGSSFLVR